MPGISSNPSSQWPRLYLCVALTTLGMLLLDLSLTRIFSVIFYYHFAFLAISIALLGLGAGGVFSYLIAGWKGNLFTKLGRLSVLGSFAVVLAVVTVLAARELTNARLALTCFATSLPFIFGGAILSLAIAETIERVHRVYFFDLLGAAGGCLLLVPLLDRLGGPNTTLASAVLFAAAAAVWHDLAGSRLGRVASVSLSLVLVGFLFYNGRYRVLDLTFAKGAPIQDEIFVQWNSFSRVAVKRQKGWNNPAIFIDADANTGIPNLDIEALSVSDRRLALQQNGQGLPYLLRPGAKTLVIGPGGGWDVAYALVSGSKDVTGVEINPIIASTIMRQKFTQESRGLYLRPEVHIFVEHGRSFLRRSLERYQVLQATMLDTWAATAAGGFALSENSIYTTDAFVDYLNHLTSDGMMAFTRWGFEPPRDSLRLVSLAIEALKRLGESDPARHVIVVRQGVQDTVLVSRQPFSSEDLRRVRASLGESRLELVCLPGESIPNQFTELLLSRDPRQYQRNYRYDITPVDDNRPSFYRAPPLLLFGLLGVSLLATLLILALPPLLLGTRLPRARGVPRFLLYFVLIGIAYVLVEVALIRKFVLFLGHPTYALTVVLFSLLVSSGLGSYCSRGFLSSSVTLPLLAGLIALLSLSLNPLLSAGVGWPLWWRVALTLLLIFPLGFLMGMPFPRGLRRLAQWHSPSVRWAWSLHAAASVLGSAAAVFSAIYLGLIQTLLAGGALYLGALLAADYKRLL